VKDSSGWHFTVGATWRGGIDAPFDLASCTKPFLASLCSQLVSERKLTWATPLAVLLPETVNLPAGAQTVEALLSHRSGLAAHREFFRGSWNGDCIRRHDVVAQAASAVHGDGPGRALYSDLGYLLVGFALERLEKTPLDELMSRHIFVPRSLRIGSARMWMASSEDFLRVVVPTELQPPRGGLLRGAVHDDNAWALSGSGSSGHAGLFAPVSTLLRFGAQTLDAVNGHRGPEALEHVRPLVALRPGGSLRMGFDGVTQPRSSAGTLAGPRTFGHLGFTGTSFWCDPDRQMVTALLSNRVSPTRDNPIFSPLRPEIHDFLWGY
jgi:CubicO group peptidase (beta-lactamase class C family)